MPRHNAKSSNSNTRRHLASPLAACVIKTAVSRMMCGSARRGRSRAGAGKSTKGTKRENKGTKKRVFCAFVFSFCAFCGLFPYFGQKLASFCLETHLALYLQGSDA